MEFSQGTLIEQLTAGLQDTEGPLSYLFPCPKSWLLSFLWTP